MTPSRMGSLASAAFWETGFCLHSGGVTCVDATERVTEFTTASTNLRTQNLYQSMTILSFHTKREVHENIIVMCLCAIRSSRCDIVDSGLTSVLECKKEPLTVRFTTGPTVMLRPFYLGHLTHAVFRDDMKPSFHGASLDVRLCQASDYHFEVQSCRQTNKVAVRKIQHRSQEGWQEAHESRTQRDLLYPCRDVTILRTMDDVDHSSVTLVTLLLLVSFCRVFHQWV